MMFAFIQAATDAIPNWGATGIGGALAVGMFYFYRQDRKDAEEKMRGVIADFRSLIEANTRAMTSLERAIEERNHVQ